MNKYRASGTLRYKREFEVTRGLSSFSVFSIKEWSIDRPPFQAPEKYLGKSFGKRESFGGMQNEKIYAPH